MIKRFLLSAVLLLTGLAHADWATDRAGSAGYVTVTTLASVIDEAVPFCVVYLSDLPSSFHSAMTAASDTDGKTIRVSTSDGSTQLACVPLGVNTGTDTGCLIFLCTGASASVDVSYRIYVGNAALTMPSASGGMGEQAVFAAYTAVYFPGMDTRNFASASFTPLVAVNAPGTGTSSVEGVTAATYVTASVQYHKFEGTPCITAWPATVEALAYADNVTTDMGIAGVHRYATTTSQFAVQFQGTAGSDPVRGYAAGDGGSYSLAPKVGFAASTWYNVAVTRSGTSTTGTTSTYIDGGTPATNSTTLAGNPTLDRIAIGRAYYNSDQAGSQNYMSGRVAWVGFSTTDRSANFLATQKQNWDGNLYSVGSWTSNSIAPGTTGWVLFQTAATTTASGTLVDWTNVNNALVDDSTYASAVNLNPSANFQTETLKLTNPAYGVTIPSGAPSYTVEFRVKRAASSGGSREIYDLNMQFIDNTGTLTGTNAAAPGIIWPTTAASYDYVMTGLTLDDTKFTSASGLAFSAYADGSSSNCDARVLTAWIKVSWTGTDQTAKARGFFALTE